MTNQSIVTIKITREELCSLIHVCSLHAQDQFQEKEHRRRWQKTHDKLEEQLTEFDRQMAAWEEK